MRYLATQGGDLVGGRVAPAGWLFAVLTVISLAGCDRDSATTRAEAHSPPASVSIHGAGSTFAAPVYAKWFESYRSVEPNVTLDYLATGSGDGVRQILHNNVDFGGTDDPMTDSQLQVYESRYGCKILHLPIALGADVPAYNLPGIQQTLNFTPKALAGIYLGKIRKWNDPELTNANPGLTLPSGTIMVLHRSDASGTTHVWTDYLSKVSSEWSESVGVSNAPQWPVGIGADGNGGVSALIKSTPNSIGYIELGYALRNNLDYGTVKNHAGEFVRADPKSVAAAAASSSAIMPGDFRISITNVPGAGAYPISSFTWFLVPETFDDAAKARAVKQFLNWALSDGQGELEPLHYTRLADAVVTLEKSAVQGIHARSPN